MEATGLLGTGGGAGLAAGTGGGAGLAAGTGGGAGLARICVGMTKHSTAKDTYIEAIVTIIKLSSVHS